MTINEFYEEKKKISKGKLITSIVLTSIAYFFLIMYVSLIYDVYILIKVDSSESLALIVLLPLMFIVAFIILILSIIGLIMGILYLVKKKKTITGIIMICLDSLGIILAVLPVLYLLIKYK